MKLAKILFIIGLVLTFAIPAVSERVVANGTVTMSGTAQGLPSITAAAQGAIIYVDGTVSTDAIRWYCGSTAPTDAAGLLALDGTTITLNSGDQVSTFQAILNSGATGAKIYYIITGN